MNVSIEKNNKKLYKENESHTFILIDTNILYYFKCQH